MLRENYIDLKKDQYRKDVSRFNAYNIFSEFNNRNSNLVCFIIFLSILLIEINHLNFFHASSFTSEGHDRRPFPPTRSTCREKLLLSLSVLHYPPFFLFFFSNSIPFPTIYLTFRNLFHVKIRLRRRHRRVREKIVGEEKERENYPSGSSVSAP